MAGLALVILVLVGVSAAVTLVGRGGEPVLLAEGTAEGAVQRYLLAIETGDDRGAYEFLSPQLLDTCTFQHFRDSLRGIKPDGVRNRQDLRVTLIDIKPQEEAVHVRVRITRFRIDPPFGGKEYSHIERYTLEQADGDWQFVERPWPMRWCADPEPARPLRPDMRID